MGLHRIGNGCAAVYNPDHQDVPSCILGVSSPCRMATSLPPADSLKGLQVPEPEESRPQCLSSDLGSEVNDIFPAALALDAPGDPNLGGSFTRNASRGVMRLIRRSTGSKMSGGKGTAVGRESTKFGSSGTKGGAAGAEAAEAAGAEAAAAKTATDATNKADGQRSAVPPTSPRPSNSFDLRRKLSDMLGLGLRKSDGGTAVLDWKPHETVLKMLDYRPRGHGRQFTDSYRLSGELGRGGFGVVREGNGFLLAQPGEK